MGEVAFDREGWMYFAQGAMTNLGIVGFKQELNSNQVTARVGYKF